MNGRDLSLPAGFTCTQLIAILRGSHFCTLHPSSFYWQFFFPSTFPLPASSAFFSSQFHPPIPIFFVIPLTTLFTGAPFINWWPISSDVGHISLGFIETRYTVVILRMPFCENMNLYTWTLVAPTILAHATQKKPRNWDPRSRHFRPKDLHLISTRFILVSDIYDSEIN